MEYSIGIYLGVAIIAISLIITISVLLFFFIEKKPSSGGTTGAAGTGAGESSTAAVVGAEAGASGESSTAEAGASGESSTAVVEASGESSTAEAGASGASSTEEAGASGASSTEEAGASGETAAAPVRIPVPVPDVEGPTVTVNRKTAQDKTLDQITSEIINKTPENFKNIIGKYNGTGDVVVCKNNTRNQNFKNMILLITDIYSDIKYYEFIEFNFTLLTKDKEGKISTLTNKRDINNFIINEMRKIQNLIDTLEKKFRGNVNYIHLFIVFQFYFIILTANTDIDKSKFPSKVPEQVMKIMCTETLMIISDSLFTKYILGYPLDYDLITYDKNKFSIVDENEISFDYIDSFVGVKKFAGRSITDVLLLKVQNIKYPKYRTSDQFTIDILYFNDEEFINTFDGSNINCLKNIDLQVLKYRNKFELRQNLKI